MRVFKPAVGLMNQLKYPQKFTLISLLFALPLAVVLFFLITELDNRIEFSQKELYGIEYLRPMRQLLEHAIQHKNLANDFLRGDASVREDFEKIQGAIDTDFQALAEADRKLGPILRSTEKFGALQNRWNDLKNTLPNLTADSGDRLYTAFIADIRGLISLAGDNSNLILDPDLDTYYLMDAVLLKLPEGHDLVSQVMSAGDQVTRQRSLTVDEKANLIVLGGLIQANTVALQKGLGVAYNNNPAGNVRPALTNPLQSSVSATEAFLTILDVDLVNADPITIAPQKYRAISNAVLAANFKLWDSSAAVLDDLLQARIDGFQRTRRFSIGVTVVVLLAVAYLWIGFYLAVMRAVASLDDASKRMVSGDMEGMVNLENRDELGQVAVSFNNIAKALVSASAHREAVVENAVDGIITVDGNGQVESVNPAAEHIFGYAKSEMVGRSFSALLADPEDEAAVLARYLPASEAGRQGATREVTGQRKNGDVFPMDLAISRMRLGDRQLYVGLLRDITERKRAQEELALARDQALEANRVKSQFLANMSHELRTPLNAIIGYSEMLMEETEDMGEFSSGFHSDLRKIHTAGKHLLGLINDILDLSKIEAGKMDLYLEYFELLPTIRDVAATILPLIERKGNRLEVKAEGELGVMRSDLTKLRQVLFNLLSNANKFTDQGQITVQASQNKVAGADWVTFEVSDSGIGMTADQMAKLFQPFTQADASTTRRYGGTGLGLVISQRFCQMLGGEISAGSEFGKGSHFTVRLPLLASEPKVEDPNTAIAEPSDGSIAPVAGTVLIIDDDPAVCDLMRRFLQKEGFRAEIALSGEQGLKRARELHPDVITLDVIMPVMDGWAVLSALKADPDTADIPVIILSVADNQNLGYALGASDYINKPIVREQLLTLLQKYRHDSEPFHALVIEDEAATREMIRRTLEREGLHVLEAENGRVGLQRVAEQTPNMIVLDLMMPEMDGFEFVVEFRQRYPDLWQTMPIIVVTARELTAEDRWRLNGHIRTYIQKGMYTRQELLSEIRTVLTNQLRQKLVGKT